MMKTGNTMEEVPEKQTRRFTPQPSSVAFRPSHIGKRVRGLNKCAHCGHHYSPGVDDSLTWGSSERYCTSGCERDAKHEFVKPVRFCKCCGRPFVKSYSREQCEYYGVLVTHRSSVYCSLVCEYRHKQRTHKAGYRRKGKAQFLADEAVMHADAERIMVEWNRNEKR